MTELFKQKKAALQEKERAAKEWLRVTNPNNRMKTLAQRLHLPTITPYQEGTS